MTSENITRQVSPATGSTGSDLSLFVLVEVLFRHIKLFLLVTAGVFALALLWIFATPRKYQSHASILVQNARSNVLISAGNSDGPTEARDVTEEQLNSEVEVLTSTDLLDDVVKPGWSSKARTSYSKSELKAHEKAVASLSRRLAATVARKSNVLLASISATSPDDAQDQLQRLLAAFIARQRQISRPPGAARFFAEQAERYKSELATAQLALAEFQKQQKLVNVNDREAILSGGLTTAESTRRDVDVQTGDIQRRIQADAVLLASLPHRQPTQEQTSPLNGALDQLTTQLVTLRHQRTELLNKYPPTDRAVKQIELQIVETETGIREASLPREKDASTDINPTWQQLQTEVTMLRSQLSGLEARRGVLSNQIADQQTALNSAEGLSPTFTALQSKVNELDGNYQTYLRKRDEAEIADSMDRQDLMNFAVVEAPTYSLSPVHPVPLRDGILGLMTAFLLGGMAVFLMESVRDTAASAAELERWSRYPVLATFPWTKQLQLATVSGTALSILSVRNEADANLAGNARLAYVRSSSENPINEVNQR